MINVIINCCIECYKCHQKILIHPKDLYHDEMYEMRSMGEETEHKFYRELCCDRCGSCIEIDISVYEYPIGAISYSESTCKGGGFIEKPRFRIEI